MDDDSLKGAHEHYAVWATEIVLHASRNGTHIIATLLSRYLHVIRTLLLRYLHVIIDCIILYYKVISRPIHDNA